MTCKARARWFWKYLAAATATVSTSASLARARTSSRCPSACIVLSIITNAVTMKSSSIPPPCGNRVVKHHDCPRPGGWAATSNHGKDIEVVIGRQTDLVEIVHTLKPIITIKGDSRAKED